MPNRNLSDIYSSQDGVAFVEVQRAFLGALNFSDLNAEIIFPVDHLELGIRVLFGNWLYRQGYSINTVLHEGKVALKIKPM